jgi:hypothetical protein
MRANEHDASSRAALPFRAVPYLSDIQHRRVLDAGGDPVGHLRDIAVIPSERIPVVRWAILAVPDGERVVRWSDIAIEPAHVRLRRRLEGLAPEALPPGAMRLGREILDQPVASGSDVERATDVQLEEAAGQLRLVGVDLSVRGLWRRIGVDRAMSHLSRLVGRPARERVVPWSEVRIAGEPLPSEVARG